MKKLVRQLQLQINERAVMTGFCYGYCKELLSKLKKLEAEGRVFQKPNTGLRMELSRKEGMGYRSPLTPIARAVVSALNEQITGFGTDTFQCSPDELATGIAIVEEFLAIFESGPGKQLGF